MSDTKISEAAAYQGRGNRDGVTGNWHAISEAEYKHHTVHRTNGYEVRALYDHPQPAELAEQQGVELPPLPASRGFIQRHSPQAVHQAHGFTSIQMEECARAALAATGKQQVGEVESLPPEMRPSDPEYLDYLDGPKQVGEVQRDGRSPMEMADALERIAGGALADYEASEADELHILRCAKLIRDLAASQPGEQVPVAWKYQDKAADGVWEDRISEKLPCWELRNPIPLYAGPPAQGIDPVHVEVIESLLQVAYAAFTLADDTEDDGESLTVTRSDFYALSAALDRLDELPDDQPGYVMECAAKARWALRGLIDQRDAAPGV